MKNILLTSLLLLAIATCFHLQSQLRFENKATPPAENPGVTAKHGPADHFFLQRSYPDNQFSQKAFLKGMNQVKQQALQRSASPGFETDWTTEGPGSAGARVNAVLIHPDDSDIIYLGYSGGGIFKTTNGGNNWMPIFDDQPYLAIGDMTFHPDDPETVFVGTGDPSITGYPFIGNGIYKTSNGGQTWTNIGLSETYIISKIIIHPTEPDVIYAATMGLPFERTNDRGLYKSTNGGDTWEQVLFVNNETGVIDLVIHPTNPDILFAGIWTRIRNNQESILTSNGPKVYRTMDAGANWQPIGNGLPVGDGGRISLSQSQQNPNTFFVSTTNTSHHFNGLYKTSDNGDSWEQLANGTTPVVSTSMFGFGWYLGRLRVNPLNEDEMFILGVPLVSSLDGGISWGTAAQSSVHVDNHAIEFADDGTVVLGNDGGAYRRPPGGGTFWEDIENIPATQVYRVTYNPFKPDNYYGGFQDNGTQTGNAATINDWVRIRGGDGFQMAFNPEDSLNFYAETQRGGIAVLNDGYFFSNATNGIISSDRRNWDMQYFISPHESDRLYTGTYRVYKTNNRAANWQVISPDLTNGIIFNPSSHTISTLDESSLDEGRIYVGTTDANVWRTTDDGNNWEEIVSGLPIRYVTSIKASPAFAETVYVTLSGYRDNNNAPFVFRSENGGTNWENIAGDLPPLAVNDIIVLPGHQDSVLVIANDAGVYASLNAGTNWERLGGNFPTVPVYDLVYNEKNNQVVAGSHGRSILSFELDNIGLFKSVQIAGNIRDWQDRPIPEVTISVNVPSVEDQVTDEDGGYNLPRIPADAESCEIKLSKNTKAVNGVGVADLINIQRHLLELDTLDNPYQWLAADVNLSGSITPIDLISMRRVILFIDTVFAATESWRFVPESHLFTDPLDPWTTDVPWSGNCNSLEEETEVKNFVAVKMGDLNGSANPNQLLSGDTREPFLLKVEDQQLEAGKVYNFSWPAESLNDVLGIACQLEFDLTAITPQEVEKGVFDAQRIILSDHLQENRWTGLAGSLNGEPLGELPSLFYIKFKAEKSGLLSEFLSLSKEYPAHVLTTKQAQKPLLLGFMEQPLSVNQEKNVLLFATVFPNPFQGATRISLVATTEHPIQLSITNSLGQIIYSDNITPPIAGNQITLDDEIFKESGIYWLTVQQNDRKVTKKLIKF